MSMSSTWLDFGSDLEARRRYFVRESFAHPAKLHLGLLTWIVERFTRPGDTIGDPMAGVGSILLAITLQRHVIARDIAYVPLLHENAARLQQQATLLYPMGHVDAAYGDARQPWGWTADHLIFSPPYACETRPKGVISILSHKQRQAKQKGWSKRWRFLQTSQAGAYGALAFRYADHPAQVGNLRGRAYWAAMRDIYTHALTALRPAGIMALIIKDHIKDGQRVMIADQTVALCQDLGFDLIERHKRYVSHPSLWQRRRKEQGQPVVEDEDILVFTRRPA